MPTAPLCALTATALLSVQAELAGRPNPPTRPLPADPVVRHPKVTVGEEKVTASSTTQGCCGGGHDEMPPLCLRAHTLVASLMVTGLLGKKVTSGAAPHKLVSPAPVHLGRPTWHSLPSWPPTFSLHLRGLPSPHPRGSHCLLTPRAGALQVTCLIQELETCP